jgi:hypothetical protein
VKRIASFVGGILVDALVFGALGSFFGYTIAQRGRPALLVRNLTEADVTQLMVHSDTARSHSVGTLSPHASQRVPLSGGDQSVWLTGSTTAGKTLESEHVYVTSGVLVFGAICADAISLEPTL